MKEIDARGLECPRPVILTKKALEETDEVSVLVDNLAARENVKRFGEQAGCKVTVVENQEGIRLHLSKVGEKEEAGLSSALAVLIKSRYFGEGEERLGEVLMRSFLVSLLEGDAPVKALIFMNSGVFLTTLGSPLLEVLQALEGKGAEIYSCGTCLDYYQLADKLAVGKVTNMYSATELLSGPYKVLTL